MPSATAAPKPTRQHFHEILIGQVHVGATRPSGDKVNVARVPPTYRTEKTPRVL